MRKFGFIFVLAVLTLIAGGALIYVIGAAPTPEMALRETPVVSTATPSPATHAATHTATPFQPLEITPTPTVTPEPSITPTETPTITPIVPTETIPPPIPWDDNIEVPEGQVKLLVLGSDVRPGGGYRTDVMILIILNPREGTASVVSFPRDLYVFIPGWGMNRLNTAMQIGGFDTMAATFEYNFGVRPDRYVLTNFDGFREIINSVGEITVEVEKAFSDKCDLWWATGGVCSIDAGTTKMDADTALWYARARYSTNDFDRTRRQQEILQGLFKRMVNIQAVFKAPEFYEYYRENVETNIGLEDMLPLIKAAPALLEPDHLRRYAIGPTEVYDSIIYGAWVLVPNPYAVQAVIERALAGE